MFLNSVFGFLPNWSSNGDNFILECGFSLRFPSAFLTESFNPKFSERNVFTRFLIDPIVLSTRPVLVCKFGVPNSSSILYCPQNCRNSFPVKAVPLSVTIFSGIPYVNIYSSMNLMATKELVLDVTHATGHFEKRSTPTRMYFFPATPSIGP